MKSTLPGWPAPRLGRFGTAGPLALGQPRRGRAPRELAELAVHMRLVEVAGAAGEPGQVQRPPGRPAPVQPAPGLVEADDPGRFLGTEPGLRAEPAAQMPV